MKAIITKHEAKEIVYKLTLKYLKDMNLDTPGVSAMNVRLLEEARQALHDQLWQNLVYHQR